jgi:hypothetical protein
VKRTRPVCYHKPGLWRVALRRLVQRGYSDAQVAMILNELDDAAIRDLERDGWGCRALEAARAPDARLVPFTQHQVRHHRRALRIRRQKGHPHPGREWWRICDWRTLQANLHAARHGWGHLIGRGREIEYARDRGRSVESIACKVRWPPVVVEAWLRSPWESLRVRETDILTALAEHGAQPWPELVARLSIPSRHTDRTTWLALLTHKRLITRAAAGRRCIVYKLSAGLQPCARVLDPARALEDFKTRLR